MIQGLTEEQFCGCLCAAAKKLNITLYLSQRRAIWTDLMTGWSTTITFNDIPKRTQLVQACLSLQRYLTGKA